MPRDRINRRTFFATTTKATAAVAAGSLLTHGDLENVTAQVNTNSSPSDLRITDLRVCPVGRQRKWMIRIDTNQGIYGLGEVRDGGSPTYALMLKSRILGMNPCNVDQIFRKLKQYGGHARQAGGPVSIEVACWDLAGKAWGVPCWQMLGGKFRNKIRMYADTPAARSPEGTAEGLKRRIETGFTFLKMDFGIEMLRASEDGLTYPHGGGEDGVSPFGQWNLRNNSKDGWTPHPFTGIQITEQGIDVIEEYVATVRELVGWDIPIATDHYGHAMINSQIKMWQRLDKYNLAWAEDCVPWWYPEQLKELKEAISTPVITGEDIYLKEDFEKLCQMGAVDMIHPDLATSGGLLETKKIGDMAMEYGVLMPMHMAGNFATWMASVHTAAATQNFLAMEHHNPDDQWYEDIFTGPPKPTMGADGFVNVPDLPGLGCDINEEAVKSMLRDQNEYFPPSDEWNDESSHDRLWSRYQRTGRVV